MSLGTVLADPLPAGLSAVPLAGEPDTATQQWHAETLSFVPRTAEARSCDPYDFISRFTLYEEAAIRTAARTDAFIEVLLGRLRAPTLRRVVFDDPVLLAGLQYLQDHDLLTAERVAEILL
ncbi:hypothetical protein [Azohydromonas lata]|uniref:Uncharacterized protein n=1 Tax=Azohydromonas lata TaxID=45677 RepID=A0ABU5ID02_9BURK|nr:hypothetical protein [Azohydromonas lata]MDZ5457004.1 hypothetical protein [Azohydromonas lata]